MRGQIPAAVNPHPSLGFRCGLAARGRGVIPGAVSEDDHQGREAAVVVQPEVVGNGEGVDGEAVVVAVRLEQSVMMKIRAVKRQS